MTDSKDNLMDKINDIIEEFDNVMLISKNSSNDLNVRPMRIARHNEESGVLYFSTSFNTGKVEEIEANPNITVTMQSSNQYVSLSGQAIVSNDRDLIADLYSPAWKAWYPDGPEQQDIRIIKFTPSQGEYWDLSGLKGLQFLWEAGKAIAQDKQMSMDDQDTHAKVDM